MYCNQQYEINKFKVLPETYIANNCDLFFNFLLHQSGNECIMKPLCSKCNNRLTKVELMHETSTTNQSNDWFSLLLAEFCINKLIKETLNLNKERNKDWFNSHQTVASILNK